jgi:hypothetical protein
MMLDPKPVLNQFRCDYQSGIAIIVGMVVTNIEWRSLRCLMLDVNYHNYFEQLQEL